VYGDDTLLICTGADGGTVALAPAAGKKVRTRDQSSVTNTQVFSSSGVAFGSNPKIDNYIIHAVSEGFKTLDPSYWCIYLYCCMVSIIIVRNPRLIPTSYSPYYYSVVYYALNPEDGEVI
jgi:hypothetical protein